MKKFIILATLVSVILALLVPAAALAKPNERPLTAKMTLTCPIDAREVLVGPIIDPQTGVMYAKIKATYTGTITEVTKSPDKGWENGWNKLEGANVTAVEILDYYVFMAGYPIPFGTIMPGSAATGVITISGPGKGIVKMAFTSALSGNYYGIVSDEGPWHVTEASGSLHLLRNAYGTWTASAAPSAEPVTGLITVLGTY